MVVTTVINGEDSFFAMTSLDDRLGPALVTQGYQVLSVEVSRGFAIFGVPYQATVKFETAGKPTDLPSLTSRVTAAVLIATGYAPASLSFPSLGQPTAPPPSNPVSTFTNRIAETLGVTQTVANVVLIAVAVGAVVIVYQVAKDPKVIRALR